MLSRLRALLTDPLRLVLGRVADPHGTHDPVHRRGITVELRQQRELVKVELRGHVPRRFAGLRRQPARGQRGLDLGRRPARDLADPGPRRAGLTGGEQGGRLLHRCEVPAVAGAVADHHVQELARLVGSRLRVQVAGHLGPACLHGTSQATVAIDHQEPAVVVGSDLQRLADPELGDRGDELVAEVQDLAGVGRVRAKPVDRDHGRGQRPRRQVVRLGAGDGDPAIGGRFGHGSAPSSGNGRAASPRRQGGRPVSAQARSPGGTSHEDQSQRTARAAHQHQGAKRRPGHRLSSRPGGAGASRRSGQGAGHRAARQTGAPGGPRCFAQQKISGRPDQRRG